MTAEPGGGPGYGVARGGGGRAAAPYGGSAAGSQSTNLADILERVLDKGLVIAGDIRVNLLDIELLTIKLRLIIASVDTAREIGINWWESDPWLTADGRDRRELEDEARELDEENRRLRRRLAAVERGDE